ncbi:tyrosine-protein kinase SRK3-like isoform X2 [Homarus americanus]|uniref:tyrosine-protein kinase SRK3-like isoform X2 n=1 Tax=Homarus americanus TaxID=6706 RepID=UPI001C47CF60|nr:tyrosine-protein kinase SRK3-like isoform X2 [Homarus americanus]
MSSCWSAPRRGLGGGPVTHAPVRKVKYPTTSSNRRNSRKSLNIFTAQSNYTPSAPGALSFCKHDKIEVLEERNASWVKGRIVGTFLEGLVPRSFLSREPNIDTAPWYFGPTSREKAEALLYSCHNQIGSFIIRDSTKATSGYTLSVLSEAEVKHYLISLNESGRVFISSLFTFSSVIDLVQHYSTYDDGLCTTLSQPCMRTPEDAGMGDQWEIDRQWVVPTGEVMGDGQFGHVFKAFWKNTIYVAVKQMKDDCLNVKEFYREAETLQRLRHPRLVKLFGLCTKPIGQPLLIVTELLEDSLHHHLRKLYDEGKPLPSKSLVHVGLQVAQGMAYLEGEKVIHRDLASRNILMARNLQVKIADFGLARFIKDNFYLLKSDVKFPVKWTAPEALIHNQYTSKSDIWSYGILLYEIFTHGGNPYPGVKGREVPDYLRDGHLNRQPPKCPDMVYTVMKDCWEWNPFNRPSFKDLKVTMSLIKDTL